MKPVLVLVSALSLFVTAGAQPPDSLWTRTYGGSLWDGASVVLQTTDGGYVLAGYTYSFGAGSDDMWLVKTNANGDSVWSRTFGGPGSEGVNSLLQRSDGGFTLTGFTSSFGAGNDDVWLVKTNANGDSLWSHTYGGPSWEGGNSVQQTTDGGYIIAGYTQSFGAGNADMWLLKTNANGDSLWSRTFGGSALDEAYFIEQTSDGGYILAGHTFSYGAGQDDFWLVKTDSNGNSLWTRTYGGPSWDAATCVRQILDGGYIVAGLTHSFGAGSDDFWLLKTNANGDSLWSRTFGGTSDERAYSVQLAASGGYILGGFTDSFGAGQLDFWLVRTNANGDSLWSRTFGGSNSEGAYFVQQTTDGGFVLAGNTMSFGAGGRDFYLVKTRPDPTGTDEPLILHPSSFILSCFPNPFNSSTQIEYALPKASRVTLTIFNLLGEKIAILMDELQPAGTHTVSFDGSGLASGVYLYRLQAEGFVQTRKMMLLK